MSNVWKCWEDARLMKDKWIQWWLYAVNQSHIKRQNTHPQVLLSKIQTAGSCVSISINFYFSSASFDVHHVIWVSILKSRPQAKPSQRQQLLHFGYLLSRDTRCCRLKDIEFCDLNNWTLHFDHKHFWNSKSLARWWRLQMFYWKQILVYM